MAFLEENGRTTKFIPRHMQRPATPVVKLGRPIPPPSTTEIPDDVLTRGHVDHVKRCIKRGVEPRPLFPKVVAPVVANRSDLIPLAPSGRPLVRSVLAAVVAASGYRHEILVGGSRSHSVVPWRMAGMYLAKKLVGASFPEIGRHFGRDHSTVIHSIRVAEGRPEIMERVEQIRDKLILPEASHEDA